MSLVDKIYRDNGNLFVKPGHHHFESEHTWNGVPFCCVTDEEAAIARKNRNVTDINWDNNTRETLVYVEKKRFPGKAEPNVHGQFDDKPVNIIQVNEDMGMLCIVLVANYAKDVSA